MAALAELNLLDSFIKESQRLHPIGLGLGGRKVMTPGGYTLSASPSHPGSKPIHIPQGENLLYPCIGIHTDPDIYPDPETFQGFRFAQDAVASGHPTEHFMSFGSGRHACPGRQLALTLIKLLTIEFLTKYDWKVRDRPKDIQFLVAVLPNFNEKVYIRRKDTSEAKL